MKKERVIYLKCKRLAGHNIKACTILLDIFDAGREDILDAIFDIVHTDASAITPEGIVSLYERSNCDIKTFIATFDKQMKEARGIRSAYYNEFERDVEELGKTMNGGKSDPNAPREFYETKYRKYGG